VFVQREAMLFGPPVVEWFAARALRRPLVLDLDDATYIPVTSPVYGRLAGVLKWRGKTNWLIDRAEAVVCGNATIASYVRGRGRSAIVLPTIVDSSVFVPRSDRGENGIPVIGWIGTHSTFPFLESIFPVLERLSAEFRFRLRVVGSGRTDVRVRVADVELAPWALDREVDDFRNIDIGLYPLNLDAFTEGKSGLKAVAYLASGVPYVASPVGIVAEIGEPGRTHFLARTPEEWYEALARLLRDPDLRRSMGRAGRQFAIEHYSVSEWAARLAETLRAAAHTRAPERRCDKFANTAKIDTTHDP
jgi:glycosyltransferase involved in cell wall biosynthesis